MLTLKGEQKQGRGGHNKETILLTIKTFKLFCIKAETTKANEEKKQYETRSQGFV